MLTPDEGTSLIQLVFFAFCFGIVLFLWYTYRR
jgi:hypothetical protein